MRSIRIFQLHKSNEFESRKWIEKHRAECVFQLHGPADGNNS